MLADPELDPEVAAAAYVKTDPQAPDNDVPTVKDALDGARHILSEQMAEDAELVGKIRDRARQVGVLRVSVVEGKEAEGTRFQDWFDWSEPFGRVASHRALAFLRGRNEGILRVQLAVDDEDPSHLRPAERMVAERFGIEDQGRPGDAWLTIAIPSHITGESGPIDVVG